MEGKFTVLDTSVLIENPNAMFEFDNVVIPFAVLDELDDLKRDRYIGTRIREVIRKILEKNVACKMLRGVDREVLIDKYNKADPVLVQASKRNDIEVVTNDIALHMKVNLVNGNSLYYESKNELYTGLREVDYPPETINELYDKHRADNPFQGLHENQFVTDGGIIAVHKKGKLHFVNKNKAIKGVGKANLKQAMATELIYDKDVTVVSMVGRAGSGKTSIAVNTAVDMVQQGHYDKIIISRAKVQKGASEEKFGYLKGDLDSKLKPFLQPFYDALGQQVVSDIIEVQGLSMVQGRDLKNSIWLITEFQDVRPQDVDGIVERIGKGSMLIIEGDINQCSRSYLNEYNNGLEFLANNLKDEELTGTITLDRVERSETAKLGQKLRKSR